MADYQLNLEVRESAGKGVARKLRAKGRIPGVCYGAGAATVPVVLDPSPLEKALRASAAGLNTLFDVKGGGAFNGKSVLVRELQRDPVKGSLLHADFYAVDLTKEIEVSVPLHLTGTAAGLMNGGIVDHQLREIHVKCLPTAIPEAFTLDVSALNVGDSLHVRDVVLPEGITLVSDPGLGVVSVVIPAKAEEEVAAEAAAAEAAAATAEGEAGAAPAEGEGAPRRRQEGRRQEGGLTAFVKLVVGLGNPGPRYARTRHNVGWRVAEHFAADCGLRLDRDEHGGRFGQGRLRCGVRALDVGVLEPQAFMNLSGDAVAEALAALPVEDPHSDLLVVFDDVDLPFGRLRLRAGGGAGGHRGLTHVIDRLGRSDFPRLRFGVGRPQGDIETADWVLQAFAPDEEAALPELVERAARAVASALCDGIGAAMNAWNRDPARAEADSPDCPD